MKCAVYEKGGRVHIAVDEMPKLPLGGLLLKTEASGLCSGELMDWYMDSKAPHVLGHEVSGRVVESADSRFPIGSLVSPHHHAPCLVCEHCQAGRHVICETWKKTRLIPGGLSEAVAVPKDNLNDTYLADALRPVDAALVEPLGCIAKSIRRSRLQHSDRVAVIGLGTMGVMHMLAMNGKAVGFEINQERLKWAAGLNLDARPPSNCDSFDVVFVCPGTEAALRFAINIAAPAARIVLFAPLPPKSSVSLEFDKLYFNDFELINSYSCGPNDTQTAFEWLKERRVRAEQVVSHFIDLDELPAAYQAMRKGDILKAMVVFP